MLPHRPAAAAAVRQVPGARAAPHKKTAAGSAATAARGTVGMTVHAEDAADAPQNCRGIACQGPLGQESAVVDSGAAAAAASPAVFVAAASPAAVVAAALQVQLAASGNQQPCGCALDLLGVHLQTLDHQQQQPSGPASAQLYMIHAGRPGAETGMTHPAGTSQCADTAGKPPTCAACANHCWGADQARVRTGTKGKYPNLQSTHSLCCTPGSTHDVPCSGVPVRTTTSQAGRSCHIYGPTTKQQTTRISICSLGIQGPGQPQFEGMRKLRRLHVDRGAAWVCEWQFMSQLGLLI